MREKADVLQKEAVHDAQALLLSMFLSEPGGVSGGTSYSVDTTRSLETPPETFGGFLVDIISKIERPPGF
jgi:hypothetical protein